MARDSTTPENNIRTFYQTPNAVSARTGMQVAFGATKGSAFFGVSIYNTVDRLHAFAYFDREEMARIRDAINRELAS